MIENNRNTADIHILQLKSSLKDVYPVTYTSAVYDDRTGANLTALLHQFNNMYLPYAGTSFATRNQLPEEQRRKGIIISYVDLDGNTVTEQCVADKSILDEYWGLDENWRKLGDVILNGELTVSSKGTWVINGEDTNIKAVGPKGDNGVTPMLKTINNKLHYSYDGIDWVETSEDIAAWFRWNATTGDTQANNLGRLLISRDNGTTWTTLSGDITNNLHISKYISADESLPTSGIAEGTIYAKGPTYDENDTSHANPIYRLWVYAWKGNTLAWQDNGEFTSIAAGVVQDTGASETEVMSQKAVSEKLSELGSLHRWFSINPNSYGVYYGSLKSNGAFTRPTLADGQLSTIYQHFQIPIEGVETIRIKSNSIGGARYALLKNNIKEEDGASVNLATGYTGTVFVDVDKWSDDIIVPSDAKVLYVRINSDSTEFVDTTPSEILFKNKDVEAKVSNPKWEHSGTSLYQSKYMRITYNEARLMSGFIPNDSDIKVSITNNLYTIFRFIYFDKDKNYLSYDNIGDLNNRINTALTNSNNNAAYVRIMISSDAEVSNASILEAGLTLSYSKMNTRSFTIDEVTLNEDKTTNYVSCYIQSNNIKYKFHLLESSGIKVNINHYIEGQASGTSIDKNLSGEVFGTFSKYQDYSYIGFRFYKSDNSPITKDEVLNAIIEQNISIQEIENSTPNKEVNETNVFLGGVKEVQEGTQPSIWTDVIISPSAWTTLRFNLPDYMYAKLYYGTYCNGTTDPSTTSDTSLQVYGGDYNLLSKSFKNGDSAGFAGWNREEGLQFVIKFYIYGKDRGINASLVKRLIDNGNIQVFASNYHENDLIEGKNKFKSLLSSPQTAYGSRDLPTFLHVSDIHSDSCRMSKALDTASELKVNAVINTGDNVTNGWECGHDWLIELEKKHRLDKSGTTDRKLFVNIVGNHDGWHAPNNQAIFDKLIAPYKSYYSSESESSIIADLCKDCYLLESGTLTNKTYYYSDIKIQDPRSRKSNINNVANQNVRIISLDLSEGVLETSDRWYISKEQIEWFITTLNNTPKDTLVIVALHTSPDTLVPYSEESKKVTLIYGDDRFVGEDQRKSYYDKDEGNPAGLRGYYLQGSPITKIIDAFISHEKISGSYTQLVDSNSLVVESVDYSADFTNLADGAEFVMYVNGHTHRDYVCYCQHSESVQLNACVTCTTGTIGNIKRTRGANSSDLIRGAGSVTQHAFNAYVIDKYHGRVGVARLGSNVSTNGIERDVVWMSYKPSVKFSIDGINLNMVKKWRTYNGNKVYDACWADFVARHSRTTTRYESDFILDYVKKTGRIVRTEGSNIAVYEYSDDNFSEKMVGYVYLNEARVKVTDAIIDGEYIVK